MSNITIYKGDFDYIGVELLNEWTDRIFNLSRNRIELDSAFLRRPNCI